MFKSELSGETHKDTEEEQAEKFHYWSMLIVKIQKDQALSYKSKGLLLHRHRNPPLVQILHLLYWEAVDISPLIQKNKKKKI